MQFRCQTAYAVTHTETQLQQELRTQTKETGFFDENTSLLPADSVKNPVSGLSVIPRETIPNSSQQNQPFIGIIDTGFTADNPNIDYSQIILGKDVIDGDNNPLLQPKEGNQHGNTILEIISDSNNPSDTKQSPTIWLGRATGSSNWHQSLIEFVDSAIAAKQPNAVVNLSFDLTQINPDGTQTTRHKLTAAEQSALKYAQENNILIVAAAGNEGTLLSALGQASTEFDNIITVGASENNNRVAYSSYGGGLDILAPTSTAQTVESSTTETKQGTSIAAAFVTNTISKMWAANPFLSRQQIKNLLLKTATDIDVPEWDERTGYGILDAELAIATAAETLPTIPVLAAAKLLTKPLIDAGANTDNSANSTAAKPSERATATTASGTPKTTSTSTGNSNEGTSSYTTELAPYTTTSTSSSNGTAITNSQTNSNFSNTESSWDQSAVKTNSKGNSFNESTSDISTNAATYTTKNFSQNSTDNKNQSQQNYSRVKYEGTRADQSSSNQKSRSSYNYTNPTYTRNDASESYRNSKSQSDSQYGTGYAMNNGNRQDDWGSKSNSNTQTTSTTGSSVNNSSTQVQGKADWTNSSNSSSSNNTHSGEETTVSKSDSQSNNTSGLSKTNNSADNSYVINSTWDNSTINGKAVNSNTRDVYSEGNSNANSSYDDGKSKNTSNRDTYTVNQSQQTNSSNGPSYWQNNRGNNYSVTQTNDTQNYKDGPYNNRHNRDSYSVSKSKSSSSNSSGKLSSKNEQENYSENNAQWENEYKVDAYTTQTTSDESTIAASKSNSSTEGSNSNSSNSSDTSRTRNSQTVTSYKDGRKTESGSSTYEKWSSESTYDSKGLVSSVSKYSSWSSSYSKSYFNGGYSWTETLSGNESESGTKGGVYTSSGSSWSWYRSGTVWDDGRNDWSESWSKSSWKDGKYLPNESESKRGGFDPKKTTPQVNDLPKFGDAPRLNKAPKDILELNKQPKHQPQPSQDLWTTPLPTPPRVIENAPDNQFAGPGAPGGKLPPNKRFALTQVIQKLLRFFRPIGEFVAGAVYQWLRNNGEPARWLLQVLIPGWNGLEKDVEHGLRQLPEYWAFELGRVFGDGAAIVTGILEMIAGGGAAGSGGSLCVTGFGCIAGAPAIVAGTALALHGSGTASSGLKNILANIAENLGVVFQSSSGSNGGGRSYEPPASSSQTYDGETQVKWRTTPNDSRPALVTFKEVNPGVVEVSEIFRRDLPSGSGGRMIVDALRTKGINRPSTIRLTNITNDATKEALKKGVAPQDTLLGNTLKNAVREMGGTPTSWSTSENARGHIWIEVKVSY